MATDTERDGSNTTRRTSQRCDRCWQSLPLCVCGEVPAVQNRTRIIVLRHHHEAVRPSNTARLAALALANIELVEWVPRSPPDVASIVASHRPAWVLYPGPATVSLSVERPAALVVLDATWKQARKMLHHHPGLVQLPRWGLPEATSRPRLRASADPAARSTLEAIADALTLLEGPHVGEPLHFLHGLLVQRVLRARGRPPAAVTAAKTNSRT